MKKESKLVKDLREDLRKQQEIINECTNDNGRVVDSIRFNDAVQEARDIRNAINYLRDLGIN